MMKCIAAAALIIGLTATAHADSDCLAFDYIGHEVFDQNGVRGIVVNCAPPTVQYENGDTAEVRAVILVEMASGMHDLGPEFNMSGFNPLHDGNLSGPTQ